MGCSGSKPEDSQLMVRCRERRDLIRAAADHRYALAAAHVSYFRSLKDVGDALRKFVDEELITTSPSSSSSFSSPSLILPPGSKKKHGNAEEDDETLHLHDDDEDEESHLHISDSSSEDGDSEDYTHHHHHNHNHHAHDEPHHHKKNSRVHKGKGIDDESRHAYGKEESSPYYPGGGFNAYGQGFTGGFVNDPYMYPNPYPYPPPAYSSGEPYMDQWEPQGMPPPVNSWYYPSYTNVNYMKKPAPASKTVIQDPPAEASYGYSDSYWNSPSGYGDAAYGGNYGYFPMGSQEKMGSNEERKVNPPKEAPPPPSPKSSTWDFFNPFNELENGYPGYYSSGRFGYGSEYSSPDSTEVREREGIPDLEEETENEVFKEVPKGKGKKAEGKRRSSGETSPRSKAVPAKINGDGHSRSVPLNKSEDGSRSVPMYKSGSSSRSVPLHTSESSSKSVPWSDESGKTSMPLEFNEEPAKPWIHGHGSEEIQENLSPPAHGEGPSWAQESSNGHIMGSMSLSDDKSSSEDLVPKKVDEGSVRKKGVTFEVGETSKHDGDSSKVSGVTLLTPHGTRDLQEVVAEIRDEFETASSYGKEVAMMLEIGKIPYQPGFIKVILSRIFHVISPSHSVPDAPSMQSAKLASRTMKLAKSYFEDVGNGVDAVASSLSSTLDKLYAWEKRLYNEVKEEERLRYRYEKQCRRLKILDQDGAESGKIEAAQASIRRLGTKLDVSVKAIQSISGRIDELRDTELQPQVAQLILGLIRMWKAMLKCHQKQFQAIMESKMRKLRANINVQTDASSSATTALEKELLTWCHHFNNWVRSQKSYVDSLNGWLLRCLQYEPEETPDGPMPFSPGRLGAPPIFVICNDWKQAMQAISEARVASAMNTFATSLRQLWEKQDEEGRQRLKADYLSKDYEKQLRAYRMERGKKEHETDSQSDKTMHMVPSENGISPLDDLKVDLDSMRHKLAEERMKHKDAAKLVHDAASSSLQGGLVPIFKALETFTSEALKAHEHVRLRHPGKADAES